jgi:DNA-binding NarL/FixJ family response regulator
MLVVEGRARSPLAIGLAAAGLEVVGAFQAGPEAIGGARTGRANVALVDLTPKRLGRAIRELCRAQPQLPVLAYADGDGPDAVLQAVEAGANGFVLAQEPLSELVRAIAQVRQGLAPISPKAAVHLVAFVREQRGGKSSEAYALTARESDVLALLVRGHSYAAIAKSLGLRLGTVQGYVKSIYRKLDVASKAEATYLAMRHNLVPGSGE